MEQNPLVSFVIPVYNVRGYLEECVRSVLAQDYQNLECICVDDGSTDGSGELLDALAKDDPRIVVVHQKNAGVSAARNNGISRTRGELLAFVDADDVIERNYVTTGLLAFSQYGDLDVWMGQMLCVDEQNVIMPNQPKTTAVYNTTAPLRDFHRVQGRYYLYSACAKLFRSALVLNEIYRFTVGVRSGEDSTFMTKVYSGVRRVVVQKPFVYRRRIHGGSLIGMRLANRVSDFLTNIEDLSKFAQKTKRESTLNRIAAESAVGSFAKIFLATTPAGAKGYAAALCSHPDFRHVILGTIARYASLKYRVCGWLMCLLPSKVIEKLLYAAWRIRKMLRRR